MFSRKVFLTLSINCLDLCKPGHGPDMALVSLIYDLFLIISKSVTFLPQCLMLLTHVTVLPLRHWVNENPPERLRAFLQEIS